MTTAQRHRVGSAAYSQSWQRSIFTELAAPGRRSQTRLTISQSGASEPRVQNVAADVRPSRRCRRTERSALLLPVHIHTERGSRAAPVLTVRPRSEVGVGGVRRRRRPASPLAPLGPVARRPVQALGVDRARALAHAAQVRLDELLVERYDILALVVVYEVEPLQRRDDVVLLDAGQF